MSSGNTQKQVMLMKDFRSTILCCTPSYALTIAEEVRRQGITPDQLAMEAGVFGAEPWTEAMRKEIEDSLGIKAMDIYGLSEVMGPGVSCSCMEQNGMHIMEDFFIPEIIDPKTGGFAQRAKQVKCIHHHWQGGYPADSLYRTRDICYLMTDPAPAAGRQPA